MAQTQLPGLQECRIEYENNDDRSTAIRFFIEKAIQDSDATVFVAESDEKVSDITDVPEVDQ